MENNKNLINFLNNEDHSLDHRLKIVLGKFISIFTTVEKQEIILNWLKHVLLTKNVDVTQRKKVLTVFKQCINASSNILLNPHLADPIFTVLQQDNLCDPELFECIIEVLKSIHFKIYFLYNIEKLSEIISSCTKRLQSNFITDDCKDTTYELILNLILYIKNNLLHGDELKLILINSLIFPISEMLIDVKKRRTTPCSLLPFYNVFQKVLFSNMESWKAFARNILKNNSTILSTDSDKMAFDMISIIRNYPTNMKLEVLTCAYSLIFESFIFSCADENTTFHVFLALNSFIYVSPLPLDEENRNCVVLKENTAITNELMKLLLKHSVSLDSQSQSITLMDWLKALIDIILNEIRFNFTISIIKMLESAFSFSPLLIENCLRKFTKNVMLLKKTEPQALKMYSHLCVYVLDVHEKQNRIHKLISALLITIKENLHNIEPEELPSKFDILPDTIFDQIEFAVTNLPSTTQSVALLNALLYHLENDCIDTLEKQNTKNVDIKDILLFDIVAHLIGRFINGTRIMDYRVPDAVQEKFILLMENLAGLLGKWGKVIISKKHVPDLVEIFLSLCLVWGDMQILFMTYCESSPRKVAKQVGATANSATNLVYLHPYLSDYHWNLIAQRIANFGEKNCYDQLNNLVVQKIKALRYLEDEIEGPYLENIDGDGPAIVCASYLANQTKQENTEWLCKHVLEFVHLLKSKEILKLSKFLGRYCQTSDENEITRVFFDEIEEIRPLTLAMMIFTFYSVGKKLASANLKEMKIIFGQVDFKNIMKAEVGEEDASLETMSEEEDESLKTQLGEIASLLSDDFTFVETVMDMQQIQKDINILMKLRLQYLKSEYKTMVCLFIICLIKTVIKLQKNDDQTKRILEDLSKLLLSVIRGVILPSSFNCGKMLVWFYIGLKKIPYLDLVMQNLYEAQQDYGPSVEYIIEIVKNVGNNQSSSDIIIQNCNEGFDLLTSYLLIFEKTRKRQNDDTESKAKKRLKKLCFKNFDKIFRSTSVDDHHRKKQLVLYTSLFEEALVSGNSNLLECLALHLSEFLKMLEEDDSDSTSEEISQFLLLLIQNTNKLESYLPRNFLLNTWSHRWFMLNDTEIRAFLIKSSIEEYKEMIYLLLTYTEVSLNHMEEMHLKTFSRVWTSVFNTSVKAKKIIVNKKIIRELGILKYSIRDDQTDEEKFNNIKRMFVQILTVILRNTKIPLHYQTVDLCFDLIPSWPNENPSNELLIECVELLFIFYQVRRSLLFHRIPVFYICYKSLFAIIVHRTQDAELNDESLVCAAHKLEKLTDNMNKYRKDFTKTAICAVSDFLNMVIEVNLENQLENHLKNIIYCWIGMLDKHGLQYLSVVMSPVVQNLFKQYQIEYQKYYKFTGKV